MYCCMGNRFFVTSVKALVNHCNRPQPQISNLKDGFGPLNSPMQPPLAGNMPAFFSMGRRWFVLPPEEWWPFQILDLSRRLPVTPCDYHSIRTPSRGVSLAQPIPIKPMASSMFLGHHCSFGRYTHRCRVNQGLQEALHDAFDSMREETPSLAVDVA